MGTSNARRRLSGVVLLSAAVAAWSAFTGGTATAAAPVGVVLGADSATAVPGSYIIVLKNGATLDGGLAARYGGTVTHTYTSALRGYSAEMSESQAARLAADPAVSYVQQDQVVHVLGTQPSPPSWGLDRVDQRDLPLDNSYTYPNDAANVHAYIIDTGVRITHTTFGGRATWGTNTIDQNNTDCHGHGTHVAGTIAGAEYGLAKAAQVVAVKVLNCSGSGSSSNVIAGMDWVTANAVKPAVANMSLGGSADQAIDDATTNSINSGVVYAVAAGNSNSDACNDSPARTPAAITVGATQKTDARASFSSYGTCLDIFAPGVDITSSWGSGDTATNTISGTSMATPHVAGAAALILGANPNYTPQQVRDAMVNAASDNRVTSPGTGSPNKLLFVGGGQPPVNDFSMSLNPTSGAIDPGQSATSTVGTTTTSGNAQTVNLTASGAPAGVTVTFNPTSVTSGNSSTMTVAASTTAAAGTYTITVKGTGSTSHTATYSLTVKGTAPGCTGAGQKLGNPGFEAATATPWTASTGVIRAGTTTQPAHGGTKLALLGGKGTTNTTTASQQVAIPAGCSTYTLSFWLHIDTTETTSSVQYDKLTVKVGSATLATYSNLNKATGYAQKTFNMAAYAGQTVTITFTGTEDISLATNFVIDDTALTVS
ncbi:hypothetical protein Lfu02_72670 [Longispora fulva]|uniref:Subtilisin family serine protease n=1 Tax=Longispora fulva TaxID=619741 RepID=A0A8J7G6N0_9ACTN|nr:S8 family peptidase [Longispora fulva]MBG6133855.1 subtilisin family serine protease [Longispora fulva]GIG62895.1 hypothetical protein Lfu02_72670 [Longispora fulva]